MTPQALRPHALPTTGLPLHNVASSRLIESEALLQHPPFTLMARAGKAVFGLSAALFPYAQRIWVACGPGHNGGDGLVAATHWQQRLNPHKGQVIVTWLGDPDSCSPDVQKALGSAKAAGVCFQAQSPQKYDLAVDAIWGLGLARPPQGEGAKWVEKLQLTSQPVVCVDLPSGLHADTGAWMANCPAEPLGPRHTLSLLTLKIGLWTGQGRACCGHLWHDDLDVPATNHVPPAWLQGPSATKGLGDHANPQHWAHKGSKGQVWIIGGQQDSANEPSMVGAAWLAARAALRNDAGRVYVSSQSIELDPGQPEIMHRPISMTQDQDVLNQSVVVCGCGGGSWIANLLPNLISGARRLLIDADGLNALASNPAMFQSLLSRQAQGWLTVLTPHPLEAARLLGTTTNEIQQNRLQAAQILVETTGCVVVLKGSGTVVAAPGHPPIVNPSGNGLLATAGTGDVLAGMLGAALSQLQQPSSTEVQKCCAQVVFAHGLKANQWAQSRGMVASDLL